MFSALPTVDHEQVLRAFVREGAIVRYLKEQASSKRDAGRERRSHRLGVRFADFYYTPNQHQHQDGSGSTTLPPIGRYFLSSYCNDDTTPRVDTRLLGILGVRLQLNDPNGSRGREEVQHPNVVPQITEGDMQELEAPLIQTTGRILTILDVVRTVLFGKGLLTTSSGSPMGRSGVSNITFDTYAYPEGGSGRGSSAPLCEATVAIRRRLFPGMLPVPILEDNNSDSDGEEHVTLGPCDGLVHENDARLRAALESAYNVAKDEFQCSSGGGIRSSAARSYIVRSVAYMRRIRDGSIQGKECADDANKSGGFLWEVVRTCQECVMQLEDLDKTYMFSSARDEFHECVGDIGPDGPTTENVLVVCGEEVKTSFAFFQDAAHSLYSWAMNCIEMINSYEQQGLLPHASPSPARRSHTIPDSKTLTSKDDDDSDSEEVVPVSDVSSSYLPLEDRAQSMYEYPLSAVTTQNVPLSEITSALADAIRYPPVMRPDCPLTARLNESCAVYVSGQRLLSVPYFSSIRQLIQTVERETDRLNKLTSDASIPASRLSPPASRFQFLLDTLRLYYIASVTADEKKTLEHFSSVTMALLSELAAERSLMEANRNSILTSLQARWDAKKEGRGQEGVAEEEDYYLPDPLLPLYTRDEKDTLNVSFGAFFRTRSAIRGLIGALQKDIMRRNRTHGVVMVTATPTTASSSSSSSRSGVFSASVVPLVVRHYRASKGKSQPVGTVRSRSAQVKQQIPMENTSVRTVSAMESDENYFQGTDASSSSLFVSPRHFYESGKNFLSRQGSRLPTLKVPLPTSTLAEWKRLVVEVPVVVRRRVEAGCSSSRAEADDNNDGGNRGGSTYPVSMVPVRAAVPLDSVDLPPTELASPDLAAELEENTRNTSTTATANEGWGFFGAVAGAWQRLSCSLTPDSQEVQDARRMPPPTPDPVFKGPPKSVVSPLVYRKEALLIALIDADNEAQRMHEALSAEYPTLYASGSNFASAERMKGASTRFASAFMPPATAAAVERDGAMVDGIMGATDRIITTIQTRTRALLDLAEVRKTEDVDPKTGAVAQPTLLAHVAKVAQQYSIVFDPPK